MQFYIVEIRKKVLLNFKSKKDFQSIETYVHQLTLSDISLFLEKYLPPPPVNWSK